MISLMEAVSLREGGERIFSTAWIQVVLKTPRSRVRFQSLGLAGGNFMHKKTERSKRQHSRARECPFSSRRKIHCWGMLVQI